MSTTSTPYRADHVGSLLRPPELLLARERADQGGLPPDELRALEDRAILDALAMQRAAGLDVCTDGEYRRDSWQSDMAEGVDGFVRQSMAIQWHGPGGGVEGSTAQIVGGRLRQRRRLTGVETAFLKEHAPGPWKMTLPPPSVFLIKSWRPGVTDQFYPTHNGLVDDLAAIIGGEVEALVQDGASYVQLDSPDYARLLDPRTREEIERSGLNPDQALELSIAGDNAVVRRGRRDGVTLALHVCRGNSKSRWFAEGGYEPIAERLFGSLEVDRFLLEYDTERAGGFEPLRFIPDGKMAVLGLISTKQGELESQDALLRRIDEAAKYHALDQLALCPQCGFASRSMGNLISADQQRRKLELVAETARKVWG